MADTPLSLYDHDGTGFNPTQIYAHRGGVMVESHIYHLPADLTEDPPPTPTTTVFTPEQLLIGAEELGTANDTLVMERVLRRASGRTGPATGVNTEYITVDFHGTEYICEDPMDLSGFGPTLGNPNRKTIWDGNVANPAVKGGIVANEHDGLDPGLIRPDSGKARNRYHIRLENCRYFTIQNFTIRGPNSTGPALTNFLYDVEREAQHAFWLNGARFIRFIDTEISQIYGDPVFTQPYRPPNGNKSTDVYPGMIEILGGTWKKIGRIYVTANQVRAPNAIVDPDFWKNPGDGSGAFEGGENSLPWANDAPSLTGNQYGIWWHGNAAHPFLGQGCKRSMVDIENMNSYAHCTDFTIGADVTSFFPQQDRQHFRFTGPCLNLISSLNAWGLVRRLKLERIWHSGTSGMSVRVIGSPFATNTVPITDIAAGSDGFALPASGSFTLHVVSTTEPFDGSPKFFPTSGYLLVQNQTIKYTGKTATSFTGCTLHYGTAGTVLHTGNNIRVRFFTPERPKYVAGDIQILDCLFDGTNTSLLHFTRAERVTIRRNRANYRRANAANEIKFSDCPNLDLGVGGQWGDNDFRAV
jgi:hypothetical protein